MSSFSSSCDKNYISVFLKLQFCRGIGLRRGEHSFSAVNASVGISPFTESLTHLFQKHLLSAALSHCLRLWRFSSDIMRVTLSSSHCSQGERLMEWGTYLLVTPCVEWQSSACKHLVAKVWVERLLSPDLLWDWPPWGLALDSNSMDLYTILASTLQLYFTGQVILVEPKFFHLLHGDNSAHLRRSVNTSKAFSTAPDNWHTIQ